MTASGLQRTRRQLWSDLLVALDGSESYLTSDLSEREALIAIRNTYSSPVSKFNRGHREEIIASILTAAGGNSSPRHSKKEMLAALVTAMGGTPPAVGLSSIEELLAACVNAADTGGGEEDMALISLQSITVPVAYVDVLLPSGYDPLLLAIDGIQLTAGSYDPLLFQFSSDGGSNWDSTAAYFSQFVRGSNTTADAIGFTGDTKGHLTQIAVADVGLDASDFFSATCWLHLEAGKTTVNFQAIYSGTTNGSEASVGFLSATDGGVYYQTAVLPNAIRISTFVGGDMMSAGKFRLIGIPTS